MKSVAFLCTLVALLFWIADISAQKPVNTIQSFSDQTLLAKLKMEQAESGLAVLVDVNTGNIIAKSSYIKKANQFATDSSLYTKAIEPGSLIMPMSAAILMDNFSIKLTDSIDLEEGKTIIDGRVIVDAELHGHRFANLKTIVSESSNVGIAKMTYSAFKNNNSLLNFNDLIMHYVGNQNYIPETSADKSIIPFQSFGYGLQLTPQQILNFYTRVAHSDPSLFKNPTTLKQVQEALIDVCENVTAKRLLDGSKYSYAGKTGTSLVAGKNGYTNKQFQAAFIGYSSAQNPKYACMVIIKCRPNAPNHFGAAVAGPVFKAIMEKALK